MIMAVDPVPCVSPMPVMCMGMTIRLILMLCMVTAVDLVNGCT